MINGSGVRAVLVDKTCLERNRRELVTSNSVRLTGSIDVMTRYEVAISAYNFAKRFLKSVMHTENLVIKLKILRKRKDIFSMKCRVQWHVLSFVKSV